MSATSETRMPGEGPVEAVAGTAEFLRRMRSGLNDGLDPMSAAERAAVRRLGRIDRLRKDALRSPARVCPRLHQVIEPLVAQAVDLISRECRLGDHLREQRQRRSEARLGHFDARAERFPGRVGMDFSAQPLGRLDGQGRRRGDGTNDRDPRCRGFLDDLEADAPRHHQDPIVERQGPGEDL